MYRKWTALMIPAALMLAFGGNAIAGGGHGYHKGHVVDSYAHVRHGAPIVTYGYGNRYRPDHYRGYRHAPPRYRHGYRKGYRHGSRNGYRPGHHRSHRGYYERPYYRSRPGGHVTLHFGF